MPASTSAAPRDWLDHPALTDSVRELARRGLIAPHAKGTLLIQEGDVGDSIHIILSGRLRSFSVDVQSGREITYGIYGPGEYLGEMGLDGGPRSASVITLEPSVCALVRRATLDQYIAEHPAFAFELLAKVIRRARATTLTARQMALHDVYGRLKALLESLAKAQPDGTRTIGERLTHQDIANRIGCTREMVSRVMRDLELGGHVQHQGSLIELLTALPARW